jgi:hypothetical protein
VFYHTGVGMQLGGTRGDIMAFDVLVNNATLIEGG